MAVEKKISELPLAPADLSGDDVVLVVQSGSTYRTLVSAVANYIDSVRSLSTKALAALVPATNKLPYFTGAASAALADVTSFGLSWMARIDAAAGRAALGLGTLAQLSVATIQAGGTNASTASQARTNLGVVFTAWTNLTLQNAWVVLSGRRAAYRSFLDMVQLEIQVSGGTATDQTVIATLPEGFRPAFPITVPVASPPNVAPAANVGGPRVTIMTNGTIIIVNCTNTQVALSITFSTV